MILALIAILASPDSFASGSSVHKYRLDGLNCPTAQRLVDKNGAVLFYFGPNDNFHRVVSHSGYCEIGESFDRFDFELERPKQSCHVGYVCVVRPTEAP